MAYARNPQDRELTGPRYSIILPWLYITGTSETAIIIHIMPGMKFTIHIKNPLATILYNS